MWRAISRLALAGLTCVSSFGCASFWDEVTSREFSVKEMVSPPEPLTVLRTSKDGDARAKAFRRLQEPNRNNAPEQQDEVVKLLTEAALGDSQPICRMAAVQTLGRFQDPRAVPALINAYESAEQLQPDASFMVRCHALSALGETKQPAAAEFLAKVARQPARSDIGDKERGQSRDVRLAAVRSLRNFPGVQAATDATAHLAQAEKDVAVRERAKESYAALTGREPAAAPPVAPAPDPIQAVKHEQPGKN